MQTAYYYNNHREYSLSIPDEHKTIMDSLHWGKFEEFFTPAFWYAQTWFLELNNAPLLQYKLGDTFKEEVIACLLGGHGIPSEVGNAKFKQFRQSNLLDKSNVSLYDIEAIMQLPINENGKEKKYRFANQKAKYIFDALQKIKNINEKSMDDRTLRDFLLTVNGIGPKTASWIIRNYRNSDNVAILDIHLYRAGLLAGFFTKKDHVEKNYHNMEIKFLAFCKELGVQASKLDAVIWRTMKELNTYALSRL